MTKSQINTIGLHEPEFDSADESLILEAIRSSWVSTGGPFVTRFEEAFKAFTGAKHAISLANGTVALALIIETYLRLHEVKEPFEVLVPDLTFIATANAVVHAGGSPVFIDAATDSMNISVPAIVDTVTSGYKYDKTKHAWYSKASKKRLLAIIPAHLFGWCCDMTKLKIFCDEAGIAVLEDAAEAVGVFWRDGRHVGNDGLAAAYSFNGNKILTTGGGGMVVTSDDKFAARLRHLSTTAKVDNLRFTHDEVGYNYRMTNLAAALGCSQLAKLPVRLQRKARIAEIYRDALVTSTDVVVHEEAGVASNHWLVNIKLSRIELREKILNALLSNNIQARPLWLPNHMQQAYVAYPQTHSSFPNATAMWEQALSLPSSPHLSDSKIAEIGALIAQTIADS